MLAAALAWAARGFPVFPLAEGTKDQPVVDEFYAVATTDPATIAMWWRDALTGAERGYNVGVSTTDMVVVDIDVRNGKQGFETFLLNDGHFDTLIVKTPSGGRHAYFSGPTSANAVGLFGPTSGLDVRSHHGYVLAPGSATAEGVYSLEIDAPLAIIPAGLKAHLRAPNERPAGDVLALTETSGMLERAVTYLSGAPAAVEGDGGDARTYQTAARLRDLGISEATALALLLDHFNPRCVPPWDADELKVKVANAYAYGTAGFGVMSPETHYESLAVPAGPHLEPVALSIDNTFVFGNALDPLQIAPRPWLYTRLLMRCNVTTIVGAGSAGKSLLQLTIAAHLAMGRPLHGFSLKDARPWKSIIYNAEDDIDEQSRRLYAICSHFRFDWPSVRSMVALVSKKQLRLQIATGDPPLLNNEHVVPLVQAARDPDVAFVSLDPLVTLHQAKEEDNTAMRYVLETAALIAEQSNTAVAIVHHTAKPGAQSKMGEMYAARGGGEIINAARVAVNLTSPHVQEATQYSIEPDKRHEFVALSDAKLNYALATGKARWFKKKGIRLPNGDEVGVLDPYNMDATIASQVNTHASAIAEAMKGRGVATCSMSEAADILRSTDLLMTKKSIGELRAQVMTTLASPVETTSGTIRVIQELVGGKFEKKVVLE